MDSLSDELIVQIGKKLSYLDLTFGSRVCWKLNHIFGEIQTERRDQAVIKIQRFWRNYRFGVSCQEARSKALRYHYRGYGHDSREFAKVFLIRLFEKTYYNSRDQHILLQQGQFFNSKGWLECKYGYKVCPLLCGMTKVCKHGTHLCRLYKTKELPCEIVYVPKRCLTKKFCGKCIKKSKNFRAEVFRLSMIGC